MEHRALTPRSCLMPRALDLSFAVKRFTFHDEVFLSKTSQEGDTLFAAETDTLGYFFCLPFSRDGVSVDGCFPHP